MAMSTHLSSRNWQTSVLAQTTFSCEALAVEHQAVPAVRIAADRPAAPGRARQSDTTALKSQVVDVDEKASVSSTLAPFAAAVVAETAAATGATVGTERAVAVAVVVVAAAAAAVDVSVAVLEIGAAWAAALVGALVHQISLLALEARPAEERCAPLLFHAHSNVMVASVHAYVAADYAATAPRMMR